MRLGTSKLILIIRLSYNVISFDCSILLLINYNSSEKLCEIMRMISTQDYIFIRIAVLCPSGTLGNF